MKTFNHPVVLLLTIVLTGSAVAQISKTIISNPKLSFSFVAGYDYALASANGDVGGFSQFADISQKQAAFNAKNYGMQSGGSMNIIGKLVANKKKTLRYIGALGYSLFYNTHDGGLNRTKWSILNLSAGAEFNLRSYPKSRPFIFATVDYNLMFGAWQTDVTFPDNTMSNVYIKFKPQSRLGITLGSGAEFKINKRTSFTAGIKASWVNIAPKSTDYTVSGYEAFINDSHNITGSTANGTKQIIYMQIYSGLSLNIF